MVKVWYLYHSCYAVQANDLLFIFDYYLDKPHGPSRSLSSGVIEPDEISRYKTFVFSSHRHPDHFNPVIFSWRKRMQSIRYVLSSDIHLRESASDVYTMKPGQTAEIADCISVTTLKSTDAGVAFLVDTGELVIYHAGDLNWWHWQGESKSWNNNMAARFKKEMEALKGRKIDIAFITTDPRQQSESLLGLEYFVGNVGAEWVFPMHFGDDYSIMGVIGEKKKNSPDMEAVQIVSKRGDRFDIPMQSGFQPL